MEQHDGDDHVDDGPHDRLGPEAAVAHDDPEGERGCADKQEEHEGGGAQGVGTLLGGKFARAYARKSRSKSGHHGAGSGSSGSSGCSSPSSLARTSSAPAPKATTPRTNAIRSKMEAGQRNRWSATASGSGTAMST